MPTGRIAYARRAALAVARDPLDGVDRVWERIRERWERPAPQVPALAGPEADAQLHALLGIPFPCTAAAEFPALWGHITAALARRGLELGRGAYGGWDDADPALSRAAWCLATHLRPRRAVETGVARGVTTRVVLEALERNGEGRLWSIDLAPLLEAHLTEQLAAAVPNDRRERWSLLTGSSRRRLPSLLRQLGEIDLFIHDSLHSERNVRFELAQAWPALRPGGVMLIDDVDQNAGFHRWLAHISDAQSVIGVAEDNRALFAVVRKPAGDDGTGP